MLKRRFLLPLIVLAFALSGAANAGDNALSYETDCVMKTWGQFLAPYEQTPQLRETIDIGGGKTIAAYDMGPLQGRFAKQYVFFLDDGQCFRKAVSFGSYMLTGMIREPRMYHVDLYTEDMQGLLDVSSKPTSFRTARKKALDVLK